MTLEDFARRVIGRQITEIRWGVASVGGAPDSLESITLDDGSIIGLHASDQIGVADIWADLDDEPAELDT